MEQILFLYVTHKAVLDTYSSTIASTVVCSSGKRLRLKISTNDVVSVVVVL